MRKFRNDGRSPASNQRVNPLRASSVRFTDTLPEPTDREVIAEVCAGNREMFEVLVRRHNQRLYRIGLAYLRDHAQAEDAMQNTYLKAFTHLGGFNHRAGAATWLTRIMINECLMLLRRRRQESLPPAEPESEIQPAQGAENLTMKEMKLAMERAVADLPPKFRRVFILREVQQLTTAETAACLKQSVANVRVTLHRAHEQLKAALLKQAAGVELFTYPAAFCDPFTTRVMAAVLAIEGRR